MSHRTGPKRLGRRLASFEISWALWVAVAVLAFGHAEPVSADNKSDLFPSTQPETDKPQKNKPDCTDPCACKGSGEPVDPYFGRWFYQTTDLEVPGVFPIRLIRYYDGSTTYQSPLGFGWAFNYDMRLFQYPDTSIIVRSTCGVKHRYTQSGAGWVTTFTPGWRNTLAQDPAVPGGFILQEPNGTRHFFDAEGRFTQTLNPQGNGLQFVYTPTQRPITGTSPYAVDPTKPSVVALQFLLLEIDEQVGGALTGRKVTFSYDSQTGALQWAQSQDGRRVTYGHELVSSLPTGNLTSVTDPAGIVQTFKYDTSGNPQTAHRVTSFQDGQGMTAHVNQYDSNGQVVQQDFGNQEFRFYSAPAAPTSGSAPTKGQVNYANDLSTCGINNIQCNLVERDVVNAQGSLIGTAKTLFQYDVNGSLVEEIDALGNLTINTYETTRPFLTKTEVYRNLGTPTAPNRVIEKRTEFVFDGAGNLSSKKVTLDPANSHSETVTESWTYDHGWVSSHQIVSSLHPQTLFGTVYTFLPVGRGPNDPITNIAQIQRVTAWDMTQSPPKPTSSENTSFAYDANGQIQTVTLPDGHQIVSSYYTAADNTATQLRNGRLKEVYHQDAAVKDTHLDTTYDYDAQGRLSTITDARGNITTRFWDAIGRTSEVDDALHEKTLFTYSSPDGTAPGHLLRQLEVGQTTADGEGQVTRFSYDAQGNLQSIDRKNDSGAFVTFSTYTSDSDGDRLSTTDGAGRTIAMEYDLLRRQTANQDLAGHRTVYGYDASGNRVSTTDAGAKSHVSVYDGLNRLIQTQERALDPAANTSFAYDAAGNLTGVTDADNHTTTYAYDLLSRLTSLTRPLMNSSTPSAPVTVIGYNYDLRGRLQQWTNGRKGRIVYGYETWGPVKSEDFYDPGATTSGRTITYGRDVAGNLLSVSDTGFSSQQNPIYVSQPGDYDALNRLRHIRINNVFGGVDFTYSYDRFGNRNGITLIDQGLIVPPIVYNYTYNKLNQLTDATFLGNSAGSTSQPFHLTYLGSDDLNTITHPSGLITQYGYETYGPLKSVTVSGAPETLAYTRDALDRVKTLTETTGAGSSLWKYDYDNGDRLADATYPTGRGLAASDNFGYDLVGNREDPSTAAQWNYDANDQILASPGKTYKPDADGNVTTITDTATGTTATLTYDVANRLTQYTKGSTSFSYTYDPFGRRIYKLPSDPNANAIQYLWDGDQLFAEYTAFGSGGPIGRTARYAYAGGFTPLQFESDKVYDVHSDHLGTPRSLTDPSGTVAWRAAYQAFGQAALDSANTVPSFNIRFPGQYADGESGLHYNRFRYYDPSIGRYVSADPVGQFGLQAGHRVDSVLLAVLLNRFRYYAPELGRYISEDAIGRAGGPNPNPYLYVQDNPTNLIDPTGLVPILPQGWGPGLSCGAAAQARFGNCVATVVGLNHIPLVMGVGACSFGGPVAGGCDVLVVSVLELVTEPATAAGVAACYSQLQSDLNKCCPTE